MINAFLAQVEPRSLMESFGFAPRWREVRFLQQVSGSDWPPPAPSRRAGDHCGRDRWIGDEQHHIRATYIRFSLFSG